MLFYYFKDIILFDNQGSFDKNSDSLITRAYQQKQDEDGIMELYRYTN
jgi:hypothetical protein